MLKIISFPLGIIFGLIILGGCHNSPPKLPPLAQEESIQVYFNHNQAKGKEYEEPYRKIKRFGDDLETVLIEQINSANQTIDIAIQELNLARLARAIVEKKKQGVKIRIVTENNYNKPLSQLPNNHGLAILKRANIPIIDDTEDGSKGSGLMHHKFVVIDQKKVVTGSANFTLSGIHGDFDNQETRGNTNHLIVFNSQEMAKIFTQEFNYLWGDGVGKKKDSLFGLNKPERRTKIVNIGSSSIVVKFSPNSRSTLWENSSNGIIARELAKANSSIDLALFVFSDQEIANTLEKESLAGVKIRVLIDPNFAYQYYSEGLDLLGVALSRKCVYENNNNPWRQPLETVGIPRLPLGDKLHHKFAIIDRYIVITGSHNWSNSANHINDETLLVIYNPLIAQHFQREFDYLYHDAILGVSSQLKKEIDQENSKCGLSN